MNPSISQEINLFRELLDQQGEVGIVIGSHQNLDTYAASLALFASLKASGKKVQIISKKSPTVEVSNLVGIDKVGESFTAGNTSKLVISLPYIKGEVEKVLFTEFPNPQNPTNINFHLTAAEGKSITPFNLSDVKLIWEGGSPAMVISVGVGSQDELAGIVDQGSTKIVNIDNFSGNSRFGDVVLVDNAFSSLSEISAKIIKDLNLPVDVDSAQNVLDGVLFATRDFSKPNTSPFAFEAVSFAMYNGAKRSDGRQSQQQTTSQPRSFSQNPDRQRDTRGQNQNRGQRVSPFPSQRVNDNDFPAMHMQGPASQQNQDDRRPRNPQRENQGRPFSQNRGQQQFGQNPQDIDDLMRKINEENSRKNQGNQKFDQSQSENRQNQNQTRFEDNSNRYSNQNVQDADIVEEPIRNQPQEVREPEEQYNAPDPSEVPDDWLMPKVFKSSKNNN